jgi:hypothetical protein
MVENIDNDDDTYRAFFPETKIMCDTNQLYFTVEAA